MKKNLYIPLIAASVLGLSSCAGDLNSLAGELMGGGLTDFSSGEILQEFDENGIPIYGYDGDSAVYGYDSNSQPIYDVSLLEQAVSVPDWEPQAGASVSYPVSARRLSAPPPQVRHHRPLRHRHPISHGPRPGRHHAGPGPQRDRLDMLRGLGPHPNRHDGPGAQSDFVQVGPASRPDRPHPGFGRGPRPDRPGLGPGNRPNRPGFGPGDRSDRSGLGHGPGSRPDRPGAGHGPGPRPNAGPGNRPGPNSGSRPESKGPGGATAPKAPGVRIAPVPTTASVSVPTGSVC